MSTRLVPFLLVFPALALFGGVPDSVAQDRTTSGTAALDAEGTVVVDNHEGRITIETWDRVEVKYEAVVRPETGAEHPEATVVRVDRGESRFVLHTEYDESQEKGDGGGLFGDSGQNIMPVEYILTVPRPVRVEVDDHESDIQVQDLSGPVALDTHDGTIALTSQDGPAELESHDGPIRVENRSGALTVDTHDGRVELTDQNGETEVESHDGPIGVEGHSGPLAINTHDSNIRLRSVDGRVTIDTHDSGIEAEGLRGGVEIDTHEGSGRFAFAELTGDVKVTTNDGNFTLALPPEVGFDLRTDFDDEDTKFRTDFNLSPYRVSVDDDDDEVNYTGSINGGGPRLFLSAAKDGDFEIRTE